MQRRFVGVLVVILVLAVSGCDNTPPNTSVVIPSDGATVSGTTLLDASASDDEGVTKVEFHLTGGAYNDTLIGLATPSRYGWFYNWDTTPVPNGAYTLNSVAFDPSGNVGRSAGVSLTVRYQGCGNPNPGLAPCDLQNAYRLPSSVAGGGQTVAIVDAFDDPNAEADLGVYRSTYHLSACTTANGCLKKVNQTGQQGNYPPPDSGWAEEIALDLNMVSAVCPNCNILLVEANTNAYADLVTAEDTAASLGATEISNSFSSSEFIAETTLDAHFNHPGIAITASSGDGGYAAGTQYPAASQYITAVGGTALTASSTGARGWSETAWPNGGSGCSAYEPKGSWQSDPGCPKHTVADVAAVATNVVVYDTYNKPGWLKLSGTSVASPLVAGVYALGAPTAPLSWTYSHTGSLFDVTSGSNGSCSGSYLCTAGPGYDAPTGVGTPCGTAAFGTATSFSPGCGPASAGAIATPQLPPDIVYAPACGSVPPGFVRCHHGTLIHPTTR
jgi:hypothetical protein